MAVKGSGMLTRDLGLGFRVWGLFSVFRVQHVWVAVQVLRKKESWCFGIGCHSLNPFPQ